MEPLSLSECAKLFKAFQRDFYEEYKVYELSSVAVAIVFPMVSIKMLDKKLLLKGLKFDLQSACKKI